MQPRSSASQKRLTPTQWQSAVELYELGYKNQRQLAEQFGISLTGMHKGLKKRGAVKGCRVDETQVALKRELARKWRAKQQAEAAWARMNNRTALVAAMMEMLLKADREGTLAELNPLLDKVRRAL